MKINKVNVIYKRSIQMRQFEPAEASISIEAQVDPSDNVDDVIQRVRKMARDNVEAEYKRLKDIRYNSIEDEKEKSA